MSPILTPGIDVALLMFWAFVLFFVGLVFYLRREDRREGYPLEDELTGRVETLGGPMHTSHRKTFRLPFDLGTSTVPSHGREPVDIAAKRTARFAGAPYVPTGDPLADGIGPAAWAERAKRPDLDMEGHPRIVPLSSAPEYGIARRDSDLIGWPVVSSDDRIVGTVSDLWIDKADRLVRYLAVALNGGAGTVLAPIMDAKLVRHGRWMVLADEVLRTTAVAAEGETEAVHAPAVGRRDHRDGPRVVVHAINAAQFARAPRIDAADRITLYEEDRVQAYFGGGYLYANAARQEPFL